MRENGIEDIDLDKFKRDFDLLYNAAFYMGSGMASSASQMEMYQGILANIESMVYDIVRACKRTKHEILKEKTGAKEPVKL